MSSYSQPLTVRGKELELMNKNDQEIEHLRHEVASLKEQISEVTRQLEKTAKEKNEYLQNIAHQVTSPLNNLKWSIESLEDPEVPIERKQVLLRSIYSQSTILVHLIKNFALMSALEAEHSLDAFREKTTVLEPKLLMINLSNDFQPQARDRNIAVVVDDESFDKFAKRSSVVGIKNLIDQVLSNILANAVKYADPNTRIVSRLRLEGDFTVISVSSRGLPISDEDRAHMFKRGFRGKGAKERLPAGTGFGLYIARRIMEIHQGKLSVTTDGALSTFEVWLPRAGATS